MFDKIIIIFGIVSVIALAIGWQMSQHPETMDIQEVNLSFPTPVPTATAAPGPVVEIILTPIPTPRQPIIPTPDEMRGK